MERRSLVLVACLAATTSCHLADDPDPIKCEPGQHPDNGRCLNDRLDVPTFTISPASGGGCTVAPESIRVAPSAEFGFDNNDTVDHTITGDDGTAWTSASSGRRSPTIGITKPGTFGFQVSGCANGGTVIVE